MWDFFAKNIGITPFGTGTGTFPPIAYQLQEKTGFLLHHVDNGVFGYCSWLHNDFLQIALEQGIVGLVLVLLFLFALFKRASRIERAGLVGVSVCALANYPLRLAVSQFIIMGMIYLSLSNNKKERI
jgi:O-antigen ligase